MTMTYAQAAILIRELRDITVNPEKHDQTVWSRADKDPTVNPVTACGTTGCLAGNAMINAGWKLVWEKRQNFNSDTGKFDEEWVANYAMDPASGRERHIQSAFLERVGLANREDGYKITESENTLADLWRIAIDASEGLITVDDLVSAFRARELKVEKDTKDRILKALSEV